MRIINMDQTNDKKNFDLTLNFEQSWALHKAMAARVVELLKRCSREDTNEDDRAMWASEVNMLTSISTTIRTWLEASLGQHEDEIVRNEAEILNDQEAVAKFLNQ